MSDGPFEMFVAELRAEPCLGEDLADQLASAFKATRSEAITNKHARSFLRGVEWIAARTEHSLLERVTQINRLTQFDGPVVMSMSLLTGWS